MELTAISIHGAVPGPKCQYGIAPQNAEDEASPSARYVAFSCDEVCIAQNALSMQLGQSVRGLAEAARTILTVLFEIGVRSIGHGATLYHHGVVKICCIC